MYDVIIIGAGPAGLTAAIYLARANKNILVLEANTYGGAIINSPCIENYPACPRISGYDFASNLYNQVKNLGVNVVFEKAIKIKNKRIKEVLTNKNKYLTRSIIIATGTVYRKLELANEDKFIGKGISYCATCDGNFYKGKVVAVVGGGNTALEDALYLSNLVKKVYLIHRRNTFRADEKTISMLKERKNIEFILNSSVIDVLGNEYVNGIKISNGELIKKIEIDGLFIAIGQKPCTDAFKKVINLNNEGFIKNHELSTNRKGIFASGDVREKSVRQLVTATSDGCLSAVKVIDFLNNNK